MNLLFDLNMNFLRVFLVVYRSGSMTLAAKELELTQSGVSQQIRALEESLGIVLFDRINRKILPTPTADILYRGCVQRLQEVETVLQQLTQPQRPMSGLIRIGVPPAFGYGAVSPLLAKYARQHPEVNFEVRDGFLSEMVEHILEADLDFAFIDSFANDTHIVTEHVATESLWLYCHPDLLPNLSSQRAAQLKTIKELPFVEYGEDEPVLRAWFHHAFRSVPHNFHIRARLSNPHSAARLILEGVAAGVLPHSIAEQHAFEKRGMLKLPTNEGLVNDINVAHLRGRSHSALVLHCLEWLKAELRRPGTGLNPGL